MKLAIIAAGEGSRLKAEGIHGSKPMVRINGVPMIERIISVAEMAGLSECCCIVNEDSRDLYDYLVSARQRLPVHVIVRSTPSSMHSLFALAPLLGESPFCLATVDAVFREEEFRGFITTASNRVDSDGTLAVTGYIHDEKPLCVALNAHGRITEFSDRAEGYNLATGGLYVFTPRIFDLMEEALRVGTARLRNFLRLLLQRGYRLHGYVFSKIIDVDHAEDILEAEEYLAGESAHRRS